MFVKPAPGLLLRDPVTKQLLSAAPVEGLKKPVTIVPAQGMEVSDFDLFWLRRIRDGDAVKAEPQTETSKTTTVSATGAAAAPAPAPEEGAK
ncbi:DUF2635 domain-containing protein [Trinickia dinghuensis]|uniref:DUF2635 domain-containing protein n=1 Tax=Trinickia dinghuensis TaxID=2291023 RepID=A0A3D8K251_9BURK|nr:DUF2635 domain-containing protein [Trinickia dinghuensis]RDU99230.1 DUF2635 domain-containing protein [Trinickia dinghuensis]